MEVDSKRMLCYTVGYMQKKKVILTLKDQKRKGVFPEHKHAKFEGCVRGDKRMTIAAREALIGVSTIRDNAYYYQTPPPGIVVVLAPVNEDGAPASGYAPAYRFANEPQFAWERANTGMWLEIDLTPCPKCGAALVWYEAGYVPGYRVCAGKAHHHFIAAIVRED